MKRLFIIFLFFISFYGNSQYYEQKSGRVLCEAIGRGFSSETTADEALKKILSVINASKRFVVQSCDNVDNAMAVTVDGIRFIYYNKNFMNDINSATNYWSNMSILAHEVGHHINGHTLIRSSLPESRKMELEADEFSGFILANLGATLSEATEAIKLISSNEDDTYSSHPSRSKRLDAITKGYNNASSNKENEKNNIYKKKSSSASAQEHFYRAYYKSDNDDHYGAISEYSKAIEVNPNYNQAYNNRGNSKYRLKDYYGAIADYSKSIEINPNMSSTYFNRGNAKYNLKDYSGACSDWKKASSMGYATAQKNLNSFCN